MPKEKYYILSLSHSQAAEYLYFLIDDEETKSVSLDINKACVVFDLPKHHDNNLFYVPVSLINELDTEMTVFESGDQVVFNSSENRKKLGLPVLEEKEEKEKEPGAAPEPKAKTTSETEGPSILKIGMSLYQELKKLKAVNSPKPILSGINDLADQIHQVNREKGFWDKERNVGEMLMLVTSELGEAMEAHRKGRFAKWEDYHKHVAKVGAKKIFEVCIKDSFEDEIADATIRLLDMAAGLNIDLEKHIQAKLDYNRTRERFHGKEY